MKGLHKIQAFFHTNTHSPIQKDVASPLIILIICTVITIVTIYCVKVLYVSDHLGIDSKNVKYTVNTIQGDFVEKVPILLYHNIGGIGPYSVSLKNLEKQFAYLKKRGITVISFSDFVLATEGKLQLSKKSVVISVDDGYLSTYTKLLPLAEKYSFPITLFVYTDFIKEKASSKITWDKLREMEKRGCDIQCHTISHADLTNLDEKKYYEKLYNELLGAKRILELHLQKDINSIAYPYGEYDLKLLEISKDAGYSYVLSTDYGANDINQKNYCLSRHHIKSEYSVKDIEKILVMK